MAEETGVLILEVPKTSILYGKVQPNDVILKLNGLPVANRKDLLKIQMGLQFMPEANIDVFRNQGLKTITIPLK
ncbi:hypothetical protein [Pedobacter sp. NJ-S-72]